LNRICAVKVDRKGQNSKELSVRRGELIEIEDSAKKWWRARNFHGEVGHVPNNILEEIEIEHRPLVYKQKIYFIYFYFLFIIESLTINSISHQQPTFSNKLKQSLAL
jgi:hypothetical protein